MSGTVGHSGRKRKNFGPAQLNLKLDHHYDKASYPFETKDFIDAKHASNRNKFIDEQRKYEEQSKYADEIAKREENKRRLDKSKAKKVYSQRREMILSLINKMEGDLSIYDFNYRLRSFFNSSISRKEDFNKYFTDTTKNSFREIYQNKFNRANK
jgi:hypothetical protein